MKFLVLALCVCAASAASFGTGFGTGFGPKYASRAVAAGSAPFQYGVAQASAVAGRPVGFTRSPAVAPVENTASAVAQAVVAPVEYAAAKSVVQTPSVESAEYTAAKAVAQNVVTPFVYAGKTASAPVIAAANYAKNALYKDGEAGIVRLDSDVQPDGFNYGYETNNGISANAAGALKQVGDSSALVIQGAYRYTAPDGTPVVFTYVADENGYQPQSDLLPVGPEIPEAIARSLEYIKSRSVYEKTQKY